MQDVINVERRITRGKALTSIIGVVTNEYGVYVVNRVIAKNVARPIRHVIMIGLTSQVITKIQMTIDDSVKIAMPSSMNGELISKVAKSWPLMRIISGGQCGSDQGGLDAAAYWGYETGGWVPAGWLTELGPMPWLVEFGCVEAGSSDYAVRTALNVGEADATLVFGDLESTGSALTFKMCRKKFKHWRHVQLDWGRVPDDRFKISQVEIQSVRAWIVNLPVRVLNVAGNRESKKPGMHMAVERFCREAFARPGVK